MAKRMPDITGQKFGKLTAVEFAGRQPRGNAHTLVWKCDCECGGTKVAGRPDLMSGRVTSCGCASGQPTHRHTNTPGYNSYRAMVNRCTNPHAKDFPRYGGRGIKIDPRWLDGENGKSGVECFFYDMGPRPSGNHSIDRIDGNLGYERSNCRWATPSEQARNTSHNYFSDGRDTRAYVEANGIKYGTFRQRVASGWPVELAASLPTNTFLDPDAITEARKAQATGRERSRGRFA